jgi:hypothetical protein
MLTIYVFPNPYGHLDHKGRLAGACLQAEGPRSATTKPARKFVGAELKMVDGSYRPDSADGYLKSRSDTFFVFDCGAPVELKVDSQQAAWFTQRDANDELFVCKGAEDLPIERLASARLKAFADNQAAYGAPPDVSTWEAQFPIDKAVAEAAGFLDADRKAKAPKEEKSEAKDPLKVADEARKDALEKASKAAAKLKEDLAKRGKPPAQPALKPSAGSADEKGGAQ